MFLLIDCIFLFYSTESKQFEYLQEYKLSHFSKHHMTKNAMTVDVNLVLKKIRLAVMFIILL